MIFLSIIIPAYNEEKRIPNTLLKLLNYLSTKSYQWEIILVDDGSTDRTSEIAREVIKNNSLRVIKNHLNQGKGYSVKRGILSSTGNVLLFSDADLSTPIEELDKMLLWIDKGYDIVIGSRALPESIIQVRQPSYRQLMGKIFNLLVKSLVLKGVNDTQCGFKCFTKESALQVFTLQRLTGFAFDVEILYIAQKCGLKIKEQPVRWINSPESKVRLLKGPLSMILELLKIRLYDWKGYYSF
ncbi:MAG: glycosyltransferase family 2 protein [Nitrospirae bacterium]|nr:glycosyltransferase family 2 protein [Nitrospirota bacterium]